MQLRKITLVTLFVAILLICSLSTISAANNTINSTSTGGIAQGITDTGTGETLFLQPGTYNKTAQDTNITINKNITLQGNGSTDSVIIDAQKLSNIFRIGNGYSVTFINMTLINSSYSGAIGSYYGTLSVANCTFINNNNTNGGAIYSYFSSISVVNCTFINNTASGGGAIYKQNGTDLTISNCTFTNNTGNSGSGAIYDVGANYAIISNCTFTNNTGNSGSGAIHKNSGYNLTIINCIFTNNTGGSTAGVLLAQYCSNSTIDNCTFTGNKATNYGGAVYNYGGHNFTVNNSIFIGNNASGAGGGAIYSWTANNFIVSNSTFTDNNANMGSAIYNQNGANFIVSNSTFTNNKAVTGGVIYNRDGNKFTVAGSAFTNNNATNGGVIYNNGTNFTAANSTFTSNNATRGGVIYNNGNNFTAADNIFNNNVASYGGGIFNNANMTVTGNTMTGNIATTLGQMIYNNGSMGILNLTFIDNQTWVVKNGSTITLYATLTDDMGNTVTWQNISFYLNGILFENVTAIEGKANMTYTPSSSGDIPVSGVYAGNGAYDILISNGLLKVRIPTKITISVPKEVKVGDTVTLESKLTDENGNPIANATVDFYVDGVKVGSGITDENGIAKLNYTFTKAGKPKVEAKYAGNDTYLASNATNSTTVSKIPTITTVETDKDTITVTLTDEDGNPLANKEVTITVNGKIYTKTTNSKGQIVMKYKNAWDYKVTANFTGDNQYLASSATAPKRTPTKTTIKTEGDKITATLTDKDGNPIDGKKLTFRVKGVIIGVGITDANGQVVIYYKNANKKAVTVSFEGDSEYMPSSATSTPESEDVQVSGKVAMKNTGIPIVTVLLALIASIGLVTARKKE